MDEIPQGQIVKGPIGIEISNNMSKQLVKQKSADMDVVDKDECYLCPVHVMNCLYRVG